MHYLGFRPLLLREGRMVHLIACPSHAYRNDPAVDAFDDSGPIVFIDGDCALCSGVARLIARLDNDHVFRICPVQSSLGRQVLTFYGLDPDDPSSWLFLDRGDASTSLDAVVKAARRLGGWPIWLAAPFEWLPKSVQDWAYRRVARNRYAVFGRSDVCAMPDPGVRARLMLGN